MSTHLPIKASMNGMLSCLFLLAFSAHAQSQSPARKGSAQSCLAAARQVLGHHAEVLKCGHLTGARAVEAVAVIRLKGFPADKDNIAISKLVVLREASPRWDIELTVVRRWMRNPAGYVGIDFIDDSESLAKTMAGYRVSFANQIAEGKPGFAIWLGDLRFDGEIEGAETEIAWNPAVGRFQEFDYGADPPGFKPEIKNPPHKFGRKPQR